VRAVEARDAAGAAAVRLAGLLRGAEGLVSVVALQPRPRQGIFMEAVALLDVFIESVVYLGVFIKSVVYF